MGRLFRFKNEEVETDVRDVLQKIKEELLRIEEKKK